MENGCIQKTITSLLIPNTVEARIKMQFLLINSFKHVGDDISEVLICDIVFNELLQYLHPKVREQIR
jgi:hypothetical protein